MQKLNLTAIIVSIIIILGVFGSLSYFFPRQNLRTIESTGIAQFSVSPDEAEVYVQVQTRADTTEAAKNTNAEITNAVFAALEKIKISKDNIETENYNIYPEYDYTTEGQKFKGYAATNSIKITTKDFDNVGKIVDAAVDAGALISYINFDLSLEKQNEYKKTALAKAAQDARSKAEAVAIGSGNKLGKLVSITTSDYNYAPYPIFRAEAGVAFEAAKIATELPSRKLDITASVSARYEID